VTAVASATQDLGFEPPDFYSQSSHPKPRTYLDSFGNTSG
jgi:hypothetical protein